MSTEGPSQLERERNSKDETPSPTSGDSEIRAPPPSIACETTSLFVGNLHPRIGDLHLQKLFSPYGEIVRIHIATHNSNTTNATSTSRPQHSNPYSKSRMPAKYAAGLHQSKGYAFVEYNNVESARHAISRLDGRQLMGKNLAVRPSRRKTDGYGNTVSGGTGTAKGSEALTAEEAKREYSSVQSKIEQVKRALEQKKRGI
jgi:RNA recognition motif-containing protein